MYCMIRELVNHILMYQDLMVIMVLVVIVFQKILSAIIKLSNDLKSTNNVIKSVKITNDKVRINRDWEEMKGRAVN